ncbi:MAG: cyclic nucleotide-binding domain-containing protein [Magnetospirillum sp. WYHS-4]
MATFEVQVALDGRWVIDSVYQEKAFAVERAQVLAVSSDYDGVRVNEEVRNRAPQVVFQETCQRREKPVTIVPIDEAGPCSALEDCYAFPARRTLGRLLRKYFDQEGLTPIEFLFDFGQLRNLQRNEALWHQGLQRIADVQARSVGGDAGDRLGELERLAKAVVDRAREAKAPRDRLALVAEEGLEAALAELEPGTAGPLLGAFLGQERDWARKLGLVLREAERNPAAPVAAILDELAAEILESAVSVRDILGRQPDLGTALLVLTRISCGSLPPSKEEDDLLGRLNGLVAADGFPLARSVLLAHVRSGLAGIAPLSRGGEDGDKESFDRLRRLLASSGAFATPAMAEAATQRMRLVGGRGGENLDADSAIEAMLNGLAHVAGRLEYLFALSMTDFGDRFGDAVAAKIKSVLEDVADPAVLAPGEDEARVLGRLRRFLEEADLTEALKSWVSGRLNDLSRGRGAAPVAAVPPAPPMPAAVVAAVGRRSSLPRRFFPVGATLFRQGDVGGEAYLVVTGRVEVYVTKDGRSVTLGTVERGGIIGEMSLIDDQPRMASARAVSDLEVSVLPRDLFRRRLDRLAETDPVIRRLIDIFVERLRAGAFQGMGGGGGRRRS